MRDSLRIIIWWVLIAVFGSISHVYAINQGDDSLKTLEPETFHFRETLLIKEILSQHHYRKLTLGDSLSSSIMDKYLSSLDYNKLYFLQEDIDQINTHRLKFDDYIKVGNISATYEIFDVFRGRFSERLDKIDELLAGDFDFTKDEAYDADREKAGWASTPDELDEIWRKVIKNQMLSLKLTGKSEEECLEVLKKRYARYRNALKKYNSEDVFQVFMNSVSESYDPHTNYFSPATADNFNIEMSRSLEGIGAQLQSINDYTTVSSIVPGGPAFKSDLIFANDKIVGVGQGDDGDIEDVIGWRLDDVVKLIRGPKGSKVRLMIISADDGANAIPHEIELIREKINLEDQRAEVEIVPIEKNGNTYRFGVINIPSFYMDYQAYKEGATDFNSTSGDVKKILEDLSTQDVDGVLIDLRRNGGGLLTEAVQLTGLFIEDGPVVQVKSSDGSVDVERDHDQSIAYDGPLAVLTSRFSASASEIFAGAIQDYKRGLVIGDNTFGKGTVQNVIPLEQWMDPADKENAGQLKLTLAMYYRVTGNSTQNKGVEPDIALPTPYDFGEIGESSEASSLPWEKIDAVNYKTSGKISPDLISSLNEKYASSLKSDEKLKDLLTEIASIRENRNQTTISLNENERKAEQAKSDLSGELDSSEVADAAVKEIDDPYVYSGILILADLVREQNGLK